jgi:hypothetical protein
MDKYIVITTRSHVFELLQYNNLAIEAVVLPTESDFVRSLDVSSITDTVYYPGVEKRVPFVSWFSNRNYYKNISDILSKYKDCKIIVTGCMVPLFRYIINTEGCRRIHLWEEGLGHYLGGSLFGAVYYMKAFYKLVCGFYSKGIFSYNYKFDKLKSFDRFINNNISFSRDTLSGDLKYYIGQPLVEDCLISERVLRKKLRAMFAGRGYIYLLHNREKDKKWLNDIFTVKRVSDAAEQVLKKTGAAEVYSAFSTVNVNISCKKNVFICKYLGMRKVTSHIEKYDFGVELV